MWVLSTYLVAEELREQVDLGRRIKAREVLNQPYQIRTRKVYHLKTTSLFKHKSTISLKQAAILYNVGIQVSTHLYCYSNNFLTNSIARDFNTHHPEPIQNLTQEALQKREGTLKRDSLCRRNHSLPKILISKVAVLMLTPRPQNLNKVAVLMLIPRP